MNDHSISKPSIARRVLVVLAAGLLTLVLGMAATASADNNPRAAQRQHFIAQAKAAGLTSAQATALQAKADRYLVKTGGTQIAANQIRQRGGHGVLTLAVPGEKYARTLGRDTAITPQASCPYYYICVYSAQNYGGDVVSAYYCNRDVFVPFVGYGSYINNQTPGTVAEFKNSSHGHYSWTRAAYAAVSSIYVTPIYYVDAC